MATAAPVIPIARDRRVAHARTWEPAVTGVVVLVGALVIAVDSGGYFERSWGLAALLLLWSSALALWFRERIRLGRLEWATVAALSAFALWTVLSALWGPSVSAPVREVSRSLVYVAGLMACLLVVRSTSRRALVVGIWGATTLVSAYSLATKLFPARLADAEDIAAARLSEPVGYWNALGLFSGLGFLLALGLLARGRNAALRAAAAASTVVLITTVYFTFSRGALVAIGIGLLVAILVDPRRLQLVTAVLAIAPALALALFLAHRSDALSARDPVLSEAVSDGRSLAAAVALLAVGAGVVSALFTLAERRIHIGPLVRRGWVVALAVVALSGLGGVFAAYGTPVAIAERAYDSLDQPTQATGGDQRRRLFTVASKGRVQHWDVAWETYRASPWLGSGAGSYERYWHEERPLPFKVRDAHSLYLETLAETGPLGLGLLSVALLVPVAAGLRARRRGLIPIALGAYAAYLAHAGIDWDWEMPVLTLIALACAATMLVSARDEGTPFLPARVRLGLLAAIVALSVFPFVWLIGSSALAASDEAREDGKLEQAESEARTAIRWLPWSEQGWLELARAQRDQGKLADARRSVRTAIAKEPESWRLWYVLAGVTSGKQRDRAIARGLALNPLSPQLAELRAALAQQRGEGR